MIECLDDVFTAKPRLIHRDIKPDNFLVRADPESKKCTIVLSDLGIAQIQNSISSSSVVKSFASSTLLSSSSSQPHKEDPSICGTLVYNSCEALQGMHSQESDAYSLGMTILAVFEGCDPFFHSPVLQGLKNRVEFATKLRNSILEGLGPKLSNSCLFRSLQTIEGGKYTPVFECLNDVFEGLTKVDIGKRMSVHKARERVQSIKRLLPDIGEGWKYPSIDDIVRLQLKKHGNNPGIIIKGGGGEKQSGLMSLMTMTTTSSSSSSSSSESSLPVGKRRFRGVNISTKVSKAPVTIMTQTSSTIMTSIVELIEKTKKTTSTEHVSFLFKKSVPNLCSIFSSLELDDAILSNHELYTKCFECLSLFVEHLALDSASSSVFLDTSSIKMLIDSLFEDMVRVEKILNPTENEDEKEKEEEEEEEEKEMSIATKSLFSIAVTAENRVESFRGKLIRQIPSVVDRFLNHVLLDIYKCYASDTLSKLYYKQKNTLLSIFLGFQSSKEIKGHENELVMCCTCLNGFIERFREEEDTKWMLLPIDELQDLNDTFLDHLIKTKDILGENSEEIFWNITSKCSELSSCEVLYEKLSPIFKRDLIRGSKEKLNGDSDVLLLISLFNFSKFNSISTKLSIISLVKKYLKPWSSKFHDKGEVIGLWMEILANISTSKSDFSLCSEVWPLFGPVIDIVRKDFVRQSIIVDGHEHVLRFLSNLCCDPSYIPQIYDKTKDLLHGWYVAIKKDNHKLGIQYWSELISRLCSVSSLVPKISPKFDIAMEWCNCNNGGEGSANFSRYTRYCYPDWKGWNELIKPLRIERCSDAQETLELYQKHYKIILAALEDFQTEIDIQTYEKQIIICFQNLRKFICHTVQDERICLPTPDLHELIDTFIDHLTRMEKVLGGKASVLYFKIIHDYLDAVKNIETSLFHKIAPSFRYHLESGCKEVIHSSELISNILQSLKYLSASTKLPETSIFELISPYIEDWLKLYRKNEYSGYWMVILSNVTSSFETEPPNEDVFLKAWSLFYPILSIVKNIFTGDGLVMAEHQCYLQFVANLCSLSDCVHVIHDDIKDMLEDWFKVIKRSKDQLAITYWSNLVSMLSTGSDNVSHLTPKFDSAMKWCYDNDLSRSDSYCVYLSNCDPNLRQWGDLLFSIRQCSDSASTARLYHDNRQAILSVFRRFRTSSLVRQNIKEIFVCFHCLNNIIRHVSNQHTIYLPISDLNNLIDSFINDLSRFHRVMSEFLDEEFSTMCVNYTDNLFCRYKSRFQDSFLPKIISNFENLLKRGSEGKLGKNVATNVTITLHNFCNCHSSGTKTSIIRLINPYFKRWLKKYPDSCILGDWMCVLAYVTWSSEENAPNESICAEAWSLFDPVVDIVKKEFVGKKITKDYHEYALLFFANLCCDPAHAHQVFKKTSDQLLKWRKIFEKVKGPGIFIWGKLISMFSTIPSLVSKIFPKFQFLLEWINESEKLEELAIDDEHLRWFNTVPARFKREKTIFGGDFKRYIRNCEKSL
ncbi:hypothetical protein ADUPG1_009180 [Aduncisulcus paluster]|uniref:Protein kinase domain-containing protein n=1 Tax=Aduncisulcus paluster TaxID=2918883 RepID=A0ABQ5KUR9_9EUKA|nr:hypothetical protein ADUPG1_009180 [Aduncisulcus paluster]